MIEILKANEDDLQEILDLQYNAYQSEARILNDPDIPPLKQTIYDTAADYEKGIILKMVKNGKIIGSVRGSLSGGTVYIGKLMVHPEYQKQGYGTMLLSEIEKYFTAKRYELFTSTLSEDNIRLYRKNGYSPFKEEQAGPNLTFIYLEKSVKTKSDLSDI